MMRVRILHEYLLRRDLIVQAKTLAKGKRLVRPRSNTYRDYLKYFFIINASGSAFTPSMIIAISMRNVATRN
jgi:hypothetical protein